MYPEHPCYDSIDDTKNIIKVTKEGVSEPLFRGRVLNSEYGFYNEKNVVCEGELAFLCDSIQRPWEASYTVTVAPGSPLNPAREILTHFITKHNQNVSDSNRRFTVGTVNVSVGNSVSVVVSDYPNTFKAIQDNLINRFGGYIYVRHESGQNIIDYLSIPPNTSDQKIEFGKNLLSIKKSVDAENIATVIIPLGKQADGQLSRANISGFDASPIETNPDYIHESLNSDRIYSQSAVTEYGWIERTVIFDDVSAKATLYMYGRKYLESIGKLITIDLTAADLSGISQDVESFKIGQYVRVNSAPHNLDNAIFAVSKLDIDLTNPTANKLTLGTETATITSQISGSTVVSGSVSGGGGGGGSYDPAGSASVALQDAKDYADDRDAEILAAALDYTDDSAYTHPTYTATDINYTSGTQQITPGTQFTLPWFSIDDTGHVYRTGLGYYNIAPYTHPAYTTCDIGRETGITTLTPGETFTLPWVHVDATGHVDQHGTSNYNIGHDDSKSDTDHTHNYAGSDSPGGVATSATKMSTARTIDGVSFDGSTNITHYCTCASPAYAATKYIYCPGFILATGARISVAFKNGNTADAITLNINTQGDKTVYYGYETMTNATLRLVTGYVYDFVYDGEVFRYVGNQHSVSQRNSSDDAQYRLLLSRHADDTADVNAAYKSGNFTANPSTGVMTAKHFKSSTAGTLLFSGGIATGTGTITIQNIDRYAALLFDFAGMSDYGTGSYSTSAIVPVAYIVAGNSYNMPTGHTVPGGARNGSITVSLSAANTLTLTGNSLNSIGSVKIYTII